MRGPSSSVNRIHLGPIVVIQGRICHGLPPVCFFFHSTMPMPVVGMTDPLHLGAMDINSGRKR